MSVSTAVGERSCGITWSHSGLLSEKRFEGCGGFVITDEVRVTIAAQACLLLLHRNRIISPACSRFSSIRWLHGGRKTTDWSASLGGGDYESPWRPAVDWVRWFSPGAPSNMAQLIPPMVRTLFRTNLLTSSTSKMTQPKGTGVGDANSN